MIARFFILCMGTAFFCIGGGIAYYTVISGGWPTTSAQVTSAEVFKSEDHDSDGHTTENYTAKLKYEYKIDSKDYTGTTVSYDDFGSSDRSHAQSIVDAYPVGSEIKIHYNPKAPQQAVIRGGSVGLLPGIFMVIGFFMVVGAILAQIFAMARFFLFGGL